MKYLILSIFIIGCASTPQPTKVKLDGKFHKFEGEKEDRFCLTREDILKINEMRVLKCEGNLGK